jgi:hypothetical protein
VPAVPPSHPTSFDSAFALSDSAIDVLPPMPAAVHEVNPVETSPAVDLLISLSRRNC